MKAIYIPNGPKNLATLFPDVNFRDVAEYYLELTDSDVNVVATTPSCQMDTWPGADPFPELPGRH